MKKRRLTTTAVLATLLSSSVAPTVTQASQIKEAKAQSDSKDKENTTNNSADSSTNGDRIIKVKDTSLPKDTNLTNKIVSEDSSSKQQIEGTNASKEVSNVSTANVAENTTNSVKDQQVKEPVSVAPAQQVEQNKEVVTSQPVDTTSDNSQVKPQNNQDSSSNAQAQQSTNNQANPNSGQQQQTNNTGSQNNGQQQRPNNTGSQNSGQQQRPSNTGSQNGGQQQRPSNPVRPSGQQRPVSQARPNNTQRPSNSNRPNTTNNSVVTTSTDLLPGTPIKVTSTMSGEEFIKSIGDFAAEVAAKNDLYASVMIAQACLETGFGSSSLSQDPYFNFFGIKGAYKGQSVNMDTKEDSASGMYTINDSFRKYPSPKESFEDYAELMQKDLYRDGVLKSKTNSYQDVTNFLTGKYATDRQYAEKLNAIIEAYDLTKYDNFDGSASKQLDKIQKEEDIFYEIKLGDTLSKIAAEHQTNIEELQKQNQDKIKDVNLIYSGQKLKVGTKVTYEYKYNGDLANSDDNNINASQGDFTLPLKPNSYTITSPFGHRGSDNHQGIDLATPVNSSVYAAKDGKVVSVGSHPSAGNYVIIDHGNHVYTNYFHLNNQCVKVGDTVKAGQLIAKSGNTGNSTGPHLHFGISNQMWNGYSDPSHYIKF